MSESSDSDTNDSEEVDTPKPLAPRRVQDSEADDSEPRSKSKSLDSSDGSSDENSEMGTQSRRSKLGKKKRAIVCSDSDSEEESVIRKSKGTKRSDDSEKENFDEESNSQSRSQSKPFSPVNSQESQDSQVGPQSTSPETRKKKRVIVMPDSDSEDSVVTNNLVGEKQNDDVKEDSSEEEEREEIKEKSVTVTLDSDSEDPVVMSEPNEAKHSDNDDDKKNSEDEMNDDEIVHKKNEMFEKFHGSDSSDEGPFINEEHCENSSQGSKEKKKERKRKPKPVEDEKLKIYSETQRMIREKEISLPYHKPKQRSLKEFLNRRKKTLTNVPLSSSFKNMQEVWKEIEESTQGVSEFFKSESEGEDEKNEKESIPVAEKLNDNEKIEKELEANVQNLKDDEESETVPESRVQKNNSEVRILDDSQSRIEDEADKDVQEEIQISKAVKNLTADLMEVEMNDLAENDKNKSTLGNKIDATADAVKEVTLKENADLNESMNAESSKLETDESISNIPTKIITDLEEKADTNSNSTLDSKKNCSNWLSNVLEYENNEKSKKKFIRRINPKLLEFTPKLSGGPNSFIDLTDEPDEIETGAKKLLDRFVKNCIIPKKKTVKNEFELTIAADERNDKGEICNIVSEKLTYRITEDIIIEDTESEKPGAKLQRLRMELQNKMAEKWEEEYKKKMAEEKEYTVAKKKEEELEEEWEEEEIEDSEEEESEPEENDVEIVDKKKKKSKFVDSEAEESGEEGGDELEEDEDEDDGGKEEEENKDGDSDKEEEEENEESQEKEGGKDDKDEDDEEFESLVPAYQPGGGFLHGGSTLTQPDKDKNTLEGLLSPSFTLSGMTPGSQYLKDLSPSTQASQPSQLTNNFTCPDSVDSHRRKLFTDSTSTGHGKFDLDDAFDFCSGRFPGATQKDFEESQSVRKINGISQLMNGDSQEFNTDDLISGKFETQKKYFSSIDNELCQGWLDTQETQKTQKHVKRRITILEDDEDSNLEMATELESMTATEISTSKRIASDDENDNAMDGLLIFNKKTKKNLKFSDDEDEGDENKEDKDEGEGVDDEESNLEKEVDESEVEKEEPEGEVDYDSEENEIIHPTEFIEKEAELSESEWSGDEDEKGMDFLDMEAGDQDQLDDEKVRSQLEKIHMRRVLDEDKREVRLLQELFFEDGDLHSDGKGRDRKFRWKNNGAFENDENRANEPGEENSDDDAVEDEQMRKSRLERAMFLMEQKKKGEIKSDDENDDDENSILKRGMLVLGKCTKTVLTLNNKPDEEDLVVKKPFAPVIKRGSFLNRNEQYLSRLAKLTGTSDNINGPKHSKNFVFATKSPEKEKIAPEGGKRKLQDCNETARKKKKSDGNTHINFGPSLLDQLV